MFQNIFSHRPPLYDFLDKAELRAFHTPCESKLHYKLSCTISYFVENQRADGGDKLVQ